VEGIRSIFLGASVEVTFDHSSLVSVAAISICGWALNAVEFLG